MNHISRDFSPGDGRTYRLHSWELRQGGFRRIAVYWGNGLWPPIRETRLINFLVNKAFKVLALDLAFGSAIPPFVKLKDFRKASVALMEEAAVFGLPVYIFASSFSASALIPVMDRIGPITAAALIAPVLCFPPPGIRSGFPCFLSAMLRMDAESISGEIILLDGLMDQIRYHRFRRSDLRALAAENPLLCAVSLSNRVAIFAGEDDPLVRTEDLYKLKGAALRVYTYARSRREVGRDKYSGNFYADMGSFLDAMETMPL